MSDSFSDLILHHAANDALAERMAAFYAGLDHTIAAYRPRCSNRGVCCHFDTYGHQLYVTTAELAYFVRGRRVRWRKADGERACPYQVDGKCEAREHRPMGCRVFFCDAEAQHWQSDEYERHLKRLKAISAACGVDYQYEEWLSALGRVEITPAQSPGVLANRRESTDSAVDPRSLPVIEST